MWSDLDPSASASSPLTRAYTRTEKKRTRARALLAPTRAYTRLHAHLPLCAECVLT